MLGAGISVSEGWIKATSHGTALEQDPKMLASLDLTQIHFPVLAINGSNDSADMRKQEFENGLADLTFVEIPNVNHMQAPRDPLFKQTLVAFIVAHNPPIAE